jgi:hypothetical protein
MFRSSSILLFLLLSTLDLCAQYEDEPKTIHLKKESTISKAQFDNNDLRLFVIDKYGNPRDNEILAYTLHVKTRKGVAAFRGASNALTGEMINYLKKQKEAAKLFFTDITVLDEFGHALKVPDLIEAWFPDCKNCEKVRR